MFSSLRLISLYLLGINERKITELVSLLRNVSLKVFLDTRHTRVVWTYG